MGLFNNIIERKADGSSSIVNYDIVLFEYARTKDLANYLHKRRNKTNILHSNIDIENNKITNIGNPGSPNDAVSKRFLYKRIQKLTTDFNLESVSGNILRNFKNATCYIDCFLYWVDLMFPIQYFLLSRDKQQLTVKRILLISFILMLPRR